jgi:hypothetical protein
MYGHERSLVKNFAGKPFALVGVNSDEDREKLKSALEENGITWRSFWNGPQGRSGPIARAWNIEGWPTLFLIDHKGVIREMFVGAPDTGTLEKLIERFVGDAERSAAK